MLTWCLDVHIMIGPCRTSRDFGEAVFFAVTAGFPMFDIELSRQNRGRMAAS